MYLRHETLKNNAYLTSIIQKKIFKVEKTLLYNLIFQAKYIFFFNYISRFGNYRLNYERKLILSNMDASNQTLFVVS